MKKNNQKKHPKKKTREEIEIDLINRLEKKMGRK